MGTKSFYIEAEDNLIKIDAMRQTLSNQDFTLKDVLDAIVKASQPSAYDRYFKEVGLRKMPDADELAEVIEFLIHAYELTRRQELIVLAIKK